MSAADAPSDRKFTTEFSLLVFVVGAYLLRAQDLTNVEISALDAGAPCHLYVISRAPRVSIDPDSVDITGGELTGDVLIQRQGDVDRRPFVLPHRLDPNAFTWQSEWPHEEYSLVNEQGEWVAGGVCAQLAIHATVWPREAKLHEILYVGQAFGTSGERTAWDRLKKHETLQKILADRRPDVEVWLTLVRVEDIQLVPEIVPGPTQCTDDEDNAHIDTVYRRLVGEGFKEREAVALAEAGLIRGWQPQYNDRLKYNFPARKQVSLDTARDLDLHGLIVEWQSEGFPVRYWCGAEGPGAMFFFGFEVHLDRKRGLTMSLEAIKKPLFAFGSGRAFQAIDQTE